MKERVYNEIILALKKLLVNEPAMDIDDLCAFLNRNLPETEKWCVIFCYPSVKDDMLVIPIVRGGVEDAFEFHVNELLID